MKTSIINSLWWTKVYLVIFGDNYKTTRLNNGKRNISLNEVSGKKEPVTTEFFRKGNTGNFLAGPQGLFNPTLFK